ncbi:MAG: 50S ribosomal protein L15 [Actinomycetota bacterium]
MKLHDLAPAPGSTRQKVRVGRGRAGRRGKTAGRGTKGAGARSQVARHYEGGQIPIHMRLPKLPGFTPVDKQVYTVINLDALGAFEANAEVSPELLKSRGLVKKKGKVKVLGRGEIDRALTIKAHAFSETAVAKIKAAGGAVEVLS